MKPGDLVKYIGNTHHDREYDDMLGIIEKLEYYVPSLECYEKIWVRWLDNADLQWADPDQLEILSEAR